uniref:CULLIN_2 domain-containing protein n=1 Tax=Caenorhabditis tropicalis TaxID=1561998 RepID=A0A1I7T5D7_9PELO
MDIDIEETWQTVNKGIGKAFRYFCPISRPRNLRLFQSKVYAYCTTLSTSNPEGNDGNQFVGAELYQHIVDFISMHAKDICAKCEDLHGEALLEYYASVWENYRFSSTVTDGLCAYLNRHWIRRELDEGRDTTYLIYTLSLVVWKKEIFDPMETKIIDAVMELVRLERTGSTINNRFIRVVVDSLVELGHDDHERIEKLRAEAENNQNNQNNSNTKQPHTPKPGEELIYYKASFEQRFLKETRDFYILEAAKFLGEDGGTCIEYMKKVETRIQQEEDRCQLCLHNTTAKPLADVYHDVLIARQIEFIQNHFGPLLVEQRDEHLGRMYNLCCRIPQGLDALRSALEKHVVKEGHLAMAKIEQEGFNDPKIYVHSLLEVYERYQDLVQKSFKKEAGFTASLDRAATDFVNNNAVTKRAPPAVQSMKSSELICRFTDQLFKKSAKMPDENEMDSIQNRVLNIFKYLEDKDVFLKYYTKMFSKRLINDLSASDEAEQSFISKLTVSCGFEYTNRLSKMVQDVQVSKDFTTNFKENNEHVLTTDGKKSIEFKCLVLSSGSWPHFPPCPLTLPQSLSRTIEAFNRYYDEKFSGRRLQWIYSQCRGEMTTTAFKGKKYVFLVTTPQMCTLLLFNEQNSFTFEQVMQATAMEVKMAQAIIQSLLTNQIVKCDKEVVNDEVPWDANITLNPTYTNKKVKVDLSKFTLKQEAVKDNEAVQRHADEDKKMMISAAIVRIMKTRKTLQHANLVAEILSQVQSRFKPKVEMVKKCIGMLIEKEYLRRADGSRDTYEYLA